MTKSENQKNPEPEAEPKREVSLYNSTALQTLIDGLNQAIENDAPMDIIKNLYDQVKLEKLRLRGEVELSDYNI